MQAPIGGDPYHPHFIVVTDQDLKKRVADLYRKASGPYAEQMEADALRGADPSQVDAIKRAIEAGRRYDDTMHLFPALVIVAVGGRYEGASVSELAGVYGSVLPAAWSFMLALRSRKLGAVWTTLHLDHEAETANVLGIPEDVTQLVLFTVGYYKGANFKPASRPPARDHIHWDRWGNQAG